MANDKMNGTNAEAAEVKNYPPLDMEAKVRLRIPVEGMANRKTFQGILQKPEEDEIGLEIEEKEGMATILHFTLADVDKANLVPQVNFRSRKK